MLPPRSRVQVEFACSAPRLLNAHSPLLEKAKDGVAGKTGTVIRQ